MSRPLRKRITFYSDLEEQLNVLTHGLGMIISPLACVLLVLKALEHNHIWTIISFPVFGISMATLYTASTLYHSSSHIKTRFRLNIFDHAAIYVLIAGTYTPFALVTLHGPLGWTIFGIIWALAITGIILKVFYIGRYDVLSTIMYVGMGWLVVFSFNSLAENLSSGGLTWVIAGGISYTVGAGIYLLRKMPFNHTIFHVFVLGGSFCHFMAIYFHVVPPI